MVSQSRIMATSALPAAGDPRLAQLYRYWLSITPRGGGLPGRQHFDPLDIPSLLPWLWLVDVWRAPLRFRYRLLGTEHVRVMERDMTGQWIDEAHAGFTGSDTYPQFVAAAERAAIGYRKGEPPFHVAKDHLEMERLLLPLAADGKAVDMLLAITVYHRRERP